MADDLIKSAGGAVHRGGERSTMTRGFVPNTDHGLLAWSSNFSERINAAPQVYHLTTAQAADYAALQEAYAIALQDAVQASTRGLATVAKKNEIREELKVRSRTLGRMIGALVDIDDAQRTSLGLTVRARWTRITTPTEPPAVRVLLVNGRTIRCRLVDSTNGRSALPGKVTSASVYFFVGDVAPAETSQWTYAGSSTRTALELQMNADVPPGAKVWIAACWLNPRSQSGPMSMPVCTHVQFGSGMRLAA